MVIDLAPASVDAPAPSGTPGEPVPPSRRIGPPAPRLLTVVLSAVMLVCALTVFFGIFVFGLSGLQEQRSQHQLYAQFRGLLSPSSPVAPSVGGAIPAGAPVALVDAPQAGLENVVVVEGTSSGDLLAGPGHLPSSPLPGQVGESVIVGKSTTAGAPFRSISRLRRGDVVTVRTGQGRFRYVVRTLAQPSGGRGRRPARQGKAGPPAPAADRGGQRDAGPRRSGRLAGRGALVGGPGSGLRGDLVALGPVGAAADLVDRGARAPRGPVGSQ
jgi:hypothetical protein